MILDRGAIKSSLRGLVGFYQTVDPSYPELNSTLITSRSSRRVNDVHPLITPENIDQTAKNYSKMTYPAFNVATEYSSGDRVSEGGVNYRYINASASTGNTPPNATYWEVISETDDLLERLGDTAVDTMLDAWINHKKLRNVVKSLYDRILLFSGVANYDDANTNADRFVGLRIRFRNGHQNLALIINKIGTHFTGSFNGLTIYVYHSGTQQAITSFTVDSVDKNARWTSVSDLILRYIDDNQQAGGEFFIGYKQSDLEALGGQALRLKRDFRNAPCTCSPIDHSYWQQYSKHFEIVGFEIDESAFGEGDTLFDPSDASYSYTNNHGLNLNMTAKCDIGQFVIDNETDFAEALNNAYALELLRVMSSSTRHENTNAQFIAKEARKEVYESEGVDGTVYDRFKKSIMSLSYDLSDVAGPCLPCDENYNPIDGMGTLQ